MAQPVKKSVSYEKNISNELHLLINTSVAEIIRDIFPSSTITPETFFLGAFGTEDCMLYKAINGYLTGIQIQELYDSLYKNFADVQGISTVRPNITIEYSAEMRTLLAGADKERENMGCKTITSDHMLLSLMVSRQKKNSPLGLLISQLNDMGVGYEMFLELSKKLHETANALLKSNLDGSVDVGVDAGVESETIVAIRDNETGETKIITGIDGLEGNNFAAKLQSAISSFLDAKNPFDQGNDVKKKDGYSSIPYCTSLNSLAEKKSIDPIIGRKKEINSIINVFARRKCNNVILVGESGVGKTAIVNGLAVMINEGRAPETIKNAEIFKFNATSVTSGTQYRGMFEERMSQITKALAKKSNPILFIDDIHKLMNEKQEYNYDFSGIMDEIFSNPNIRVIAATTQKGYHSSFENNTELSRHFQKVIVSKQSIEECNEIIESIKPAYEKFHKVKYSDKAICACVTLADRYITDRNLPMSAIDILDEAGASKKVKEIESEHMEKLKDAFAECKKEKEENILKDDMDEVLKCDKKLTDIKLELASETNKKTLRRAKYPIVSEEDIYSTVSEHTGIPVQKINVSEKKALAKIDDILKKDIIGQDEAIEVVSRAIKRNKVGLYPSNRPILSCMCIGSTGCGKTLLAKKLALEVFGDVKYLIRFDMSEYSDKTSINKLIGASAGYVGYNEGGILTERVKNNKYAVVLFDEIEKANEEIYNLFLQILDEGTLTDNTGQKVDFKNTILILTSNVGTKKAADEKGIGFNVNDAANKKDIIEKELKKKFPPEFINRLDEVVYFNTLTDDNLKSIIKLELGKLSERINNIGFKLSYTDDVVNFIFDKIKPEKDYGARPILRAIQKEIENKITDIILENDIENGNITAEVENNDVKISLV